MIVAFIIAVLGAGFVSGGLATLMCRRGERCFSINLLAGLIGAGSFAWLFQASGIGFRDFDSTLYFALAVCMTGALMAQFLLSMVRSASRKP